LEFKVIVEWGDWVQAEIAHERGGWKRKNSDPGDDLGSRGMRLTVIPGTWRLLPQELGVTDPGLRSGYGLD